MTGEEKLKAVAEQYGRGMLDLLEDILDGRARIVLRHTPIKPADADGQFGSFETSIHVVRGAPADAHPTLPFDVEETV